MMRNRRDVSDGRRAFTLVEMLVVIAIIGILASLAAWGVFAMINRSHSNNTQSTIKVVNKLMFVRWNQVNAESKKEAPSPVAVLLANGPEGNLDPTGARARVIMAKARLVEAFPMSYAEVTASNIFITPPNLPKPYVAKYKSTVAGMTGGGPGESAACLLMALKTLQGDGGVAVEDQLKYAIALTDGINQIPTLQDSWGTPMAFFRFPWNNLSLLQANPARAGAAAARFADPIDTGGILLKMEWWGSKMTYPAAFPIVPWRNLTAKQVYETTFSTTIAVPGSNPPAANYTIPVVASGGPNKVMDLAADLSAGPLAADNIFSFQLKLD